MTAAPGASAGGHHRRGPRWDGEPDPFANSDPSNARGCRLRCKRAGEEGGQGRDGRQYVSKIEVERCAEIGRQPYSTRSPIDTTRHCTDTPPLPNTGWRRPVEAVIRSKIFGIASAI
ncbi:unnamed protein product [Urochloa humidicola]